MKDPGIYSLLIGQVSESEEDERRRRSSDHQATNIANSNSFNTKKKRLLSLDKISKAYFLEKGKNIFKLYLYRFTYFYKFRVMHMMQEMLRANFFQCTQPD